MRTRAAATGVAVLLTVAACSTDGQGSAGPRPEPTASLAELLPSTPPGAHRLAAPSGADRSPTSVLGLGFRADAQFFLDVLFVPVGATLRASSATTAGGRTQLAIEATIRGACSTVLVGVRRWFTRGGFTEAVTRETSGGAELTFSRDDGNVTVATAVDGRTCMLAELGVLTAGRASRQ
ncbi:hypothetical protein [Xylanimonas sp. McL0601]|uniref:hypothetical protein n=1 Tax=Xylanimonas sp. McL0601 TaxID=3414739 RepID=UPI003CF703B7